MTDPIQQLRDMLAEHRWSAAVELLRRGTPREAAEMVLALPYERQQALFRRLPKSLATTLIAHLPYFHAYVLLYSLPTPEMAATIEAMNPTDRDQFLDELPEETWQVLQKTLEEARLSAAIEATPAETGEMPAPTPPAESQPIIEAWQLEKDYRQPEGRTIQVVAPIDLSIAPNTIVALLGPSGCGKSTILRMLSGLLVPSKGEVLWHGQPLRESHPNVAIVFQSFALFPWLTVLENVEAPLQARGVEHPERHARALQALGTVGLKGFESAYPKELSG